MLWLEIIKPDIVIAITWETIAHFNTGFSVDQLNTNLWTWNLVFSNWCFSFFLLFFFFQGKRVEIVGTWFLSYIALADLEFRNLLCILGWLWSSFHSFQRAGITGKSGLLGADNSLAFPVTPLYSQVWNLLGERFICIYGLWFLLPRSFWIFCTLISCLHFMPLWLDVSAPPPQFKYLLPS